MSKSLNRRLAIGAGASLSLGIARNCAMASPSTSDDNSKEAAHGFSEIRLHTTHLEALHRFYADDLGLTTLRTARELTVHAGLTRIIFQSNSDREDDPYYHFAFNIPQNKLPLARAWQKNRCALIRRGNNEVIHFSRWNAHSVFFNDPAGNILEYIARHDLENSSDGPFTPRDILYASEIGLVVDDVSATVAAVKEQLGMRIYRDNSQYFASMGDEHALLILVKRERKWTPDKVRAARPFPTEAAIRGSVNRSISMRQHQYKISIA